MKNIALSIAGSDPSGGAGIQADMRMFFAQGVYGCSVITGLTAQHPTKVTAVCGVSSQFVQKQLETLLTTLEIAAIKTGMLWSKENILAIAETLENYPHIPIVIDPVMISSSGTHLLNEDAVHALQENLLPLSSLLTPNLMEAEVLLKHPIHRNHLHEHIQELHQKFGCAILLKGGHLEGTPIDMLFDGEKIIEWRHPRVQNLCTHGTGCMLSASITAQLAQKKPLPSAVEKGILTLHTALRHPISIHKDIDLAGIEHTNQDQLLQSHAHEIQRKEYLI